MKKKLSNRMKEAIELLKQEEFYLWESQYWNRWKAYGTNKFIRTDTMNALKRRGIVEITYCGGGRRYNMSAKLTKESLCINKECEPPYGGKDNCEFNNNGICTAKSL